MVHRWREPQSRAFAGVLLIMVGLLHAIQGFVALLSDDIYLRGENYVFDSASPRGAGSTCSWAS